MEINSEYMATQASPKYDIQVPKYVLSKTFTLGLAEKPDAAKKLAGILDSKSKKFNIKVTRKLNRKSTSLPDVPAYYVNSRSKPILIVPASGHIFTLVQDGVGWQYPVYDFRWTPNHLANRSQRPPTKPELRNEAIVEAMRFLVGKTEDYIIMTDYDEEGEVIGGLILAQLAGEDSLQKAKRMKYSSFAKQEILDSYASSKKTTMNFGMYNRGLMRHYLDWLWGINLSRALMLSLKNTSGNYLTLSTGRVQGPTLAFVSDRMMEINSHVPIPYFKISLTVSMKEETPLELNEGLVDKESWASQIVKDTTNQIAKVTDIRKTKRSIPAPVPFNLSKLQSTASSSLGFKPSRTQRAAEALYLDGAISYPRTSSEEYPPDLDHKDILGKLGNMQGYSKIAKSIVTNYKKPVEGKKKDPAHPCIYPTGAIPSKKTGDEAKLFHLIASRYFSTFGSPTIMENTRIEFDINSQPFHLSGRRTVKLGWRAYASEFGKSEDREIPLVKDDDQFSVRSSSFEEYIPKPPSYYSQSSLLKRMESEEIGTKATRADIIKSLLDRKYLRDDPITITPVGEIVNQVLKTYSSQVISVELSRTLEQLGDMIEEAINNNTGKYTLADAIILGIEALHDMLDGLQENEELVGSLITKELKSQRRQASELGTCLACNVGTLKIMTSQRTGKRFVGCSEYFNNKACTESYPLPAEGRLEPLSVKCENDGYPLIKVYKGKRPWILCLKEGPLIKNKSEKNGKTSGKKASQPKKSTAAKKKATKKPIKKTTLKKSTTKKTTSKKKTTAKKTSTRKKSSSKKSTTRRSAS